MNSEASKARQHVDCVFGGRLHSCMLFGHMRKCSPGETFMDR